MQKRRKAVGEFCKIVPKLLNIEDIIKHAKQMVAIMRAMVYTHSPHVDSNPHTERHTPSQEESGPSMFIFAHYQLCILLPYNTLGISSSSCGIHRKSSLTRSASTSCVPKGARVYIGLLKIVCYVCMLCVYCALGVHLWIFRYSSHNLQRAA